METASQPKATTSASIPSRTLRPANASPETANQVALPRDEENRIVLNGISWSQYKQLQDVFAGRHVRLTFDRGVLEIMTTGHIHEGGKTLLGRLIEAMSLELDIPIAGLGEMTWEREFLEHGLESDECYFIKNEPLTHDLEKFDPQAVVPDLVIEIEASRRLGTRREMYAAMGVPEMWCFNGKALTFLHLTTSKQYEEKPDSLSFPFLAASDLERFLLMRSEKSEHEVLKAFRNWLRKS